MPAFVFLSHSSKDDATVTRIHDQIEAITRQDVWVDHRDLAPGGEWQKDIDAALAKLTHMLVILSQTSVTSTEVTAEWRDALLRKKPLLPVIIDDVPLESIPSRLRIITGVDLHKDWDGGIKLLAAVITRAESGTSTPEDFARWPVTGLIDRRLVSIPISGREADLTAVRGHLAKQPTTVLGVGGLGKSRLAAELVLTQEGVSGAVWHVCDEFSTAEDVLVLLRDHLSLDPTTERRDLLKRLRAEHLLIVLDNAESVDEDDARRQGYVQLVDELHAAGQQVLLTSRVPWPDFQRGTVKLHQLEHPAAPACRQIVLDMAAQFDITGYDLPAPAAALAAAARYHPRLIEWAVGKLTLFAPDKVLRELTDLKSKDVQAALDEMITQTVRQMTDDTGPAAAAALRRLTVCRAGFTYNAAGYLLQHETLGMTATDYVTATELPPLYTGEGWGGGQTVPPTLNTDALDDILQILARWQFVRPTVTNGQARYTLDPLVIAALDSLSPAVGTPFLASALVEDAASDSSEQRVEVAKAHYDYYKALAWQHDERQDYLGLDPESANLEAAFEWAMVAERYEDALNLANACGQFFQNRGRFEQILRWDERIVAELEDHPDKMLWANAQNSLAIDYGNLPVGNRRDNLRRAVTACEAALAYRTAQAAPLDNAMTQTNLGNAYQTLAQLEDREDNLKRAVKAYEAALVYYTPQATPLDNAMTQTNLGAAYRALAQIEEREANLKRAVAAYEAALLYGTPQAAPLDYAMTRNNLGNAYADLAQIEEREANLKQALAAFEAALVYRTAQAAPLDYAMTQNNLGIAYRNLSEIEEREANLKRAVAAFEAALVYRTPQAAPLDYAMTQNNLGIAYRNLSEIEEREANLKRALAAYEAALLYRTPQAAPLAYAMTRANMGLIHQDLGDMTAALEAWREAVQIFQDMGMNDYAARVQGWIADAEG